MRLYEINEIVDKRINDHRVKDMLNCVLSTLYAVLCQTLYKIYNGTDTIFIRMIHEKNNINSYKCEIFVILQRELDLDRL